MSVVEIVPQHKLRRAALNAIAAVRRDIQFAGNHLAAVKIHPNLVAAQQIRIFLYHLLRQGFPQRFQMATEVELTPPNWDKKQHDRPHPKHPAQLGAQLFTFCLGDTLDLPQALRLMLQNL